VSACPRHPILVVSLAGRVIERLRKEAFLSQERLAAESESTARRSGRYSGTASASA